MIHSGCLPSGCCRYQTELETRSDDQALTKLLEIQLLSKKHLRSRSASVTLMKRVTHISGKVIMLRVPQNKPPTQLWMQILLYEYLMTKSIVSSRNWC